MFGAFKKLGNNIASLDKNKLFREIFSEPLLQAEIIDLNQKQLYEEGVDSKGVPTGEYSDATIYGTSNFEGKIEKGERYDHITLKDTGESYDSMKVEVEESTFSINGNFPQSVETAFPDALGLTTESKKELIPTVNEYLIDKIKTKLHK